MTHDPWVMTRCPWLMMTMLISILSQIKPPKKIQFNWLQLSHDLWLLRHYKLPMTHDNHAQCFWVFDQNSICKSIILETLPYRTLRTIQPPKLAFLVSSAGAPSLQGWRLSPPHHASPVLSQASSLACAVQLYPTLGTLRLINQLT